MGPFMFVYLSFLSNYLQLVTHKNLIKIGQLSFSSNFVYTLSHSTSHKIDAIQLGQIYIFLIHMLYFFSYSSNHIKDGLLDEIQSQQKVYLKNITFHVHFTLTSYTNYATIVTMNGGKFDKLLDHNDNKWMWGLCISTCVD